MPSSETVSIGQIFGVGAVITILSLCSGAFLHHLYCEERERQAREREVYRNGMITKNRFYRAYTTSTMGSATPNDQPHARRPRSPLTKESSSLVKQGSQQQSERFVSPGSLPLIVSEASVDEREVVVPDHGLRSLISEGNIFHDFSQDLQDFVQPASIDIPIHTLPHVVKEGFEGQSGGASSKDGVDLETTTPSVYLLKNKMLPLNNSVREMIKDLALEEHPPNAVMLKGQTYLVYCGRIFLPANVRGALSPKSSIGRIDLMVRGIIDYSGLYDIVKGGRLVELWVEVTPNSFNVRIHHGIALTQLMLFCPAKLGWTLFGLPPTGGNNTTQPGSDNDIINTPTTIGKKENNEFEKESVVLYGASGSVSGATSMFDSQIIMSLSVPYSQGEKKKSDTASPLVGYEARNTSEVIDLGRRDHDPELFFRKIRNIGDSVTLSKDRFYILATKEAHYAGFFDPGFGFDWGKGSIVGGSIGVLEVRPHETVCIKDGQPICMMRIFKNASLPTEPYGCGTLGSNYAIQKGPKLAKYFSPWKKEAIVPLNDNVKVKANKETVDDLVGNKNTNEKRTTLFTSARPGSTGMKKTAKNEDNNNASGIRAA
eukprot:g3217.t1